MGLSTHLASSQLPIILIPGAPVPSSDLYGYMNAYSADTNAKAHTHAHNINLTIKKTMPTLKLIFEKFVIAILFL